MIKFFVYRTSTHMSKGWVESFNSIEELLNWIDATQQEVIITDNFLYEEDPDHFDVPAEWTKIKYAFEIYDDYRE